jgi:hypothetical protein
MMTAAEVYELTTPGGATDIARLIQACESFVVAFSVLGDLTTHL